MNQQEIANLEASLQAGYEPTREEYASYRAATLTIPKGRHISKTFRANTRHEARKIAKKLLRELLIPDARLEPENSDGPSLNKAALGRAFFKCTLDIWPEEKRAFLSGTVVARYKKTV